MNFFILLLSFISYSTSIINGFSANSFGRFPVSGSFSKRKSFSDTLSLASVITRFPDGTTNVCGGVLIAPSIVITSAHCVFSGDDLYVKTHNFVVNLIFYSAVTAKVTLGDVHLNKHDDGEQEFRSHAMAISKKFFNDVSRDTLIGQFYNE